MRATILISSYCRPWYLEQHLRTLQATGGSALAACEIVVLNDGIRDGTEAVAKKFGANYLFTGQRNSHGLKWRVPGFAFNIGIRRSTCDIIILTCAEIYHINNALAAVLVPVVSNELLLGTPHVYDDPGPLAAQLRADASAEATAACVANVPHAEVWSPFMANAYMPYFLAVRRQRLLDIGGYDEDFIGIAADDNDLMDRLLLVGCQYSHTGGKVVHLHHGSPPPGRSQDPRYRYNVALWEARKGIAVRNIGRKWGELLDN